MFRTGLTITIAAAVLLVPAAAEAEVVVKGTGEPPFTNSANNTQWVDWSNTGPYRIEFNHHVNGGQAVVDGPYNVAQTGSTFVNWSGIRGTTIPLQEGNTYMICGFGRWQDAYGMWFPDFSTACGDADRRGLRASTTIDRTAPTISVVLASGAAAVRSGTIPMRVNFADNIAGPFPANFVCVQYGAPNGALCDAGKGYQYIQQPACSQPLTGGRTSNAFECNVEVGTGPTPAPDGPVHVCVMAADAAIPDNPTSPDQRGTSTSANRSAPKCASTLLDRVAPTASISGPSELKVGQSALFSATVADATSGIAAGTATITWGDATAPVKAVDATHAFAGPGTYRIRFTVADVAGNQTEVTKDVRVVEGTPNPNPNPNPDPNPNPNPTPTPTPTPSPAPNPAPQPRPSQGTTTSSQGTTTTSQGTQSGVGTSTGTATTGGPLTAKPAAGLTVRVLGVRRRGARRVVRLGVPGATGSARVVLKRGAKTVATARLAIRAGRVELVLPKRVAGGVHTVQVTAGTRTGRATVRLPGARPRAAAAAAGRTSVDGLDRKVLPGI